MPRPDAVNTPGELDVSWLGEAVGAPVPLWPPHRGYLALHERGFVLGPPGRERTVLFAEVQSLAIAERGSFDRILAGTVERRITLKSAAGAFRFAARSIDGLADPARTTLAELERRLVAVADQRLRGGDLLAGRGWRLAPEGLRTRRGSRAVPFSAMTRAGLFIDRIGIWRNAEAQPFFTVSAESVNARLLRGVLVRRLGRAAGSPGTAPLGRFLFDLGRTGVYEHGLVQRGLVRRRKLLFDEVARMRVRASSPTRRAAIYEGTARIAVRFPASHESHELLIGRPASILADRLARQLTVASEVPWVAGVRITKEGVVRERRSGSELLPFAAGLRIRLVRGRCHIDLPGHTSASLTIDTAAWDFFPGLLLLERIYSAGFTGG